MVLYRVPSDSEVGLAIRAVMKDHTEVGSLKLFHELVLGKLKKIDPDMTISPERLRRTAALMIGMKVHVEKGHSEKIPHKCYVCGGELGDVKTMNLYGSKTVVGKKCRDCGYKVEKGYSVPRRYRFYKR